jgi:hypothetical protein
VFKKPYACVNEIDSPRTISSGTASTSTVVAGAAAVVAGAAGAAAVVAGAAAVVAGAAVVPVASSPELPQLDATSEKMVSPIASFLNMSLTPVGLFVILASVDMIRHHNYYL